MREWRMKIKLKALPVITRYFWRSGWLHPGCLVAAVAFSLSLGACSGDSWKEEALQPDGSAIIVTRSVERGGRHEVGQQGAYIHQTLSFKMPGSGQKIEWVDALSPDLGNSSFLPMLLGVSKEAAYLLATPMGCLSYNKWGRPNPPYVVFKYTNKQWDRVALSELPLEFKVPNLIQSSPDIDSKKTGESPVSAKTIANMVSEYKQPEFKSIVREAITGYGNFCSHQVSNGKGTWLSVDWFTKKESLDTCLDVCRRQEFGQDTCPCSKFFKGK